ncbi:hypothetical protein [Streptomyces sp. TRM70350]|uniref:hypothetical protein n=1 Tax=Streptomyces sp. TRM70350 TaxID=2856165 RepID=UPI001C4399E2|nr:hypothetical protein [Streptomyces sp. TRM70350]MBV7701033.1 hypothetical protein [Streptomyces sp. TRM70350]
MFGGATVRTVISVLAAVLLALPFFAPTASFASVHTARHAVANAQPGIKPSGEALRDEIVHCRGDGDLKVPSGPVHNRDRDRAADFVPEAPDRPLLTRSRTAADEEVIRGTALHRKPGSAIAHSPAALQVFRC